MGSVDTGLKPGGVVGAGASAAPEKPLLIMQATGGKHNEDIEGSYHRITKGRSWKKSRVVVVIPAAKAMPTQVAFSHWGLIFPPNQPVYRFLALGQEVGEAFSNAIFQVISHPELSQWEYLLTIEHDNMPPPDGVLKLIEAMESNPQYSAIGGLYWTKGEMGVPQIWGDPKDPVLNYRPQAPRPGELQECCGTGMGFTMYRLAMFKDEKLRRPWFKTRASKEEGLGTQDLYFYDDARKHGYRCAVDNRILVGHFDPVTEIIW
jgi:hypothetical protein